MQYSERVYVDDVNKGERIFFDTPEDAQLYMDSESSMARNRGDRWHLKMFREMTVELGMTVGCRKL